MEILIIVLIALVLIVTIGRMKVERVGIIIGAAVIVYLIANNYQESGNILGIVAMLFFIAFWVGVWYVLKYSYKKIVQKTKQQADKNKFYSKVVGVTYLNDDGSDRQQLIKHYCKKDMPLDLEFEINSRTNERACRVLAGDKQIGFLHEALAKELYVYAQQAGRSIHAIISDCTGGEGQEAYGVNIVITKR